MDNLLQKTLEIAIEVLTPIILTALVALISQAWANLRKQIPEQQYRFAEAIITNLVLAAEQKGLKDDLLKTGREKRKWVIEQAAAQLAAKGIKIDVEVLYSIIEAQVHKQFNQNAPTTTTRQRPIHA